MIEIYVMDLETSGLVGYPFDVPIELAVYKINFDLSVSHVYDSLIKWDGDRRKTIDESWWSKQSGVYWNDTQQSKKAHIVWNDLKRILDGKYLLTWNTEYDLDKFIIPMFDIFGKINFKQLPCPMKVATPILAIPHYYYGVKFPTLAEAVKHYKVQRNQNGYFHRAKFDTHHTALVVAEMIKTGDYKLQLEIDTK